MKKITALLLSAMILFSSILCVSAKDDSNDEYDFKDNEVIVVLTEEATKKVENGELKINNDYFTSTEFTVVNVSLITEWTRPRIFLITLDKHDFENVLKAAKIINSYDDVELAEPNYRIHPADNVENKKANPVKIIVKKKTVKAEKLKKSKVTVKALKLKNVKGSISFTKVKSGTTAKIYKKITVNKTTGAITVKKSKYTKKTYNLKVKINVSGNSVYKPKTIYKTVKIKIK